MMEEKIKDYIEANHITSHPASEYYEDAGGHLIHETDIIEMIEQEELDQEAEWHRAEDEARRSADKLCSNESRI
tara:strand:- start:18 stop:239 length:222 start_codon:yes stop_codon:yes gene_type:complete